MRVKNPNCIMDRNETRPLVKDMPVGTYLFLDDATPGIIWKVVSPGRIEPLGSIDNDNPGYLDKQDITAGIHMSADRTGRILRVRVEEVKTTTLVVEGFQ